MRLLKLLMLGLAAAGAGAYVLTAAWLYMGQDDQIFPRTVNQIENPAEGAPENTELLGLPTPDGATLGGILFNARQASPTLVIAYGGNAHDVTGMARFLYADVFNNGAHAVVGFSYRGYPNAIGWPSTGKPTEKNLKADALLIYDTLTNRLQPSRVVVVGYSLGSAMATHVAANRPVHAAILVTPFAALVDIAQLHYRFFPANLLVNHPFRTEDALPDASGRITIVATATDAVIPPDHPQRLLNARPDATLIMLEPPPSHGDALDHPDIPTIFRNAAE